MTASSDLIAAIGSLYQEYPGAEAVGRTPARPIIYLEHRLPLLAKGGLRAPE